MGCERGLSPLRLPYKIRFKQKLIDVFGDVSIKQISKDRKQGGADN